MSVMPNVFDSQWDERQDRPPFSCRRARLGLTDQLGSTPSRFSGLTAIISVSSIHLKPQSTF